MRGEVLQSNMLNKDFGLFLNSPAFKGGKENIFFPVLEVHFWRAPAFITKFSQAQCCVPAPAHCAGNAPGAGYTRERLDEAMTGIKKDRRSAMKHLELLKCRNWYLSQN